MLDLQVNGVEIGVWSLIPHQRLAGSHNHKLGKSSLPSSHVFRFLTFLTLGSDSLIIYNNLQFMKWMGKTGRDPRLSQKKDLKKTMGDILSNGVG